MDDHLFTLIHRLPPGKWQLLVEGVRTFHPVYKSMHETLRTAEEPFRSELRAALDLERYRGATAWGPFCTACGKCCPEIKNARRLFDFLLDDHNKCRHHQPDGRCAIYANRPLPCRVDDLYDALYTNVCSREDFYAFNAACCALRQRLSFDASCAQLGLRRSR